VLIELRLYMFDGFYQSIICFFIAYLLFRPANFVSNNGLSVDDRERFGTYIAPATVAAVNIYVLLNTYRWDWLMVLLTSLSILLVFFWTGIYSSFSSSEYFYKAAAETFGLPTFWAVTFLSVIIALLPRFLIKVLQKVYFPYDIDIIRERVQRGEYDYLNNVPTNDILSKGSSTSESDIVKPVKHTHYASVDEDRRPIYPPSVAPTATTHNPRSHNGSDGTEYSHHRVSAEMPPIHQSIDRSRSSYDRMRASMDRIQPSYERSNDFTSAALLTRLESTRSVSRR
jgi:phospholipid-translocating ATPase